ncbi:hypothetical protein JTE90_020900 [Oedothorax gibbosus]|uniref:AH domain-containing protein n=1 Tax=Oedothorax gibbosus TaxID=931172 RepID=A0AAV6VPT3_9ARAC|nr:hypothetical protein JTE90_020900 [Oedothorax gibbosus]
MSNKSNANSSALTKLQQAYWEAKRNLKSSLGTHDDECWISTDFDLDSKIQLMEEADNSYNDIMKTLLLYKRTLCTIMTAEENLGSALVEYGIGDSTQAGKLLMFSGRAISQSANQRHRLKSNIVELYHEVRTFHFNATVDVLKTVSKMENVRKSYRSGLMWMKNESQNLDPDVTKKMKKFRKVQEHIKNLKIRFDASKLETMQKIDLYLLSRCNLFSKSLVPYREIFCKMSMDYSKLTMAVVQSIPSYSFYTFETLKQLNEYSAKPNLDCGPSPKQKNRDKASVKRNLKVKKGSKSSYIQPKSTTKAIKFRSAKCTPTKKVSFKSPLESELSNEKSSAISEALLINVHDDENNLLNLTQHPLLESIPSDKKSSTISEALLINLNDDYQNNLLNQSEPNVNSKFGKYSEDLLSLQMDSNMSGDSIKKSDEKKDFEDELEKCFEELNDLHIDHTVSEDLQFWSLMESLNNSEDKEENSNIKSPINPIRLQQEDSNSKWEDLLIEFDPYSDSNLNTLDMKMFTEDC